MESNCYKQELEEVGSKLQAFRHDVNSSIAVHSNSVSSYNYNFICVRCFRKIKRFGKVLRKAISAGAERCILWCEIIAQWPTFPLILSFQ